jgi:hypothetical protein
MEVVHDWLAAEQCTHVALESTAASMLTAAYHILRSGRPYHDLTDAYFDSRDRARIARRLIRRLNDLGLQVEVRPAA